MSGTQELMVSDWTATVLDALRLPGESFDEAIERLLTDGLAYQRRLDEKYGETRERPE
jgi:hypothetical protein